MISNAEVQGVKVWLEKEQKVVSVTNRKQSMEKG